MVAPPGTWSAIPKPARLLIVAAAVLLPLLAMLADSKEDRALWFQRGGCALQLLGFLTVFKQVRDALLKYQRPTLVQAIRQWIADRLHRPVTVALTGQAMITVQGSVNAKQRRGLLDESVTTRLGALEFNLGQIDQALDSLRLDVQKRANDLSGRMDAERDNRDAALQELAGKVEDQAVGSAGLQLVGLALFVAGIVYGTVPADVAGLLGKLFGR
jgi:hypothetical protein